MTASQLSSAFGWLGVAGGLAYLPARFLICPAYTGKTSCQVGIGLDVFAVTMSLFLLMGLLLIQMDRAGRFTLLAFLWTFLFSSLWAGHQLANLIYLPILHSFDPQRLATLAPPGAFMAFTIGTVIAKALGWIGLGAATMRTEAVYRFPAALLIVGSLSDFVGDIGAYLSRFIVGVAFIWLGIALTRRTVQQPHVGA